MTDPRYGGPSTANSLWKGVEWTGSKIGLSGAQSRQYFPYAIIGLILIVIVIFLFSRNKDKLKKVLPKSSGGGKSSSGSKWSFGSGGSSSGKGKLKKWFSGDPLGISGEVTDDSTSDQKHVDKDSDEYKKKRSMVIDLIVNYLKEFKGKIENALRNLEKGDYQDVIEAMNEVKNRIKDTAREELNKNKKELGRLFSVIINDFLNNLEKNAETVIVMITGTHYERAAYYLNEMKKSIETAIPNVEKQKEVQFKQVVAKHREMLNTNLWLDYSNKERITKVQYKKLLIK
jgi:hypothetical protein